MSLKRIKGTLTVKPPETSPNGAANGARLDSWRNIATNLGVSGSDKRLAGEILVASYREEEAERLWQASDLAARIVETVPNEMTREGWRFTVDGAAENDDSGADVAKTIGGKFDELEVAEKVNEALCYRRAYGGGAILLGVDDGQRDLGRPLDEKRIRPGSFRYLTLLTPRECMPVAWYDDPQQPKFGLPKIYQVSPDVPGSPTGMLVHETRILRFIGARTSRRSVWRTQYRWGDSVFVRVGAVLRDWSLAYDGGFALVNDFAQAVLKIKGLADMVASDDPADANAFMNRVKAFDYTRSVVRTALLDADGEDFERKSTPVAGLPEMFSKFDMRLAAAADMPVTLLMGQSPAGLNATGASDIRFFYDRIAAAQRTQLRPVLNTLARLIMLSERVKEPENWAIQFNPLWQLDGQQVADMRLKNATADNLYFQMGALSPHEIRDSRFGTGEYGTEIHLDAETQDALNAPDLTDDGEPKPLQTARISTAGPTPPDLEKPAPGSPAAGDEKKSPAGE
jgi:phage-related protein (TIGR01555 family)